jgi:acetolactate synthase-1/3 small subunit
MKQLHTILVFAQNKRGVLERIAMLIRKKMYNLEQITASDTDKDGIKRITIAFSHEESDKLPQIISQMNKIVEVIETKLVDPAMTIQREVALIKVKRPDNLSELLSLVQVFKGQVVHTMPDNLVIQVTGTTRTITEFLSVLRQDYTVLEFGSTGSVAMEQG